MGASLLHAPWSAERGSASERVQRLLETIGVRALGLGERLEPVGDLAEALFARRLGHPRIHVGVLVGLAGDRGLQIVARLADRQAGRWIADRLEIFQVSVCVAGLAFRGRTEYRRDVVESLHVGLLC